MKETVCMNQIREVYDNFSGFQKQYQIALYNGGHAQN